VTLLVVGPPTPVGGTTQILAEADWDVWFNWLDTNGTTIPLSTYSASLTFSAGQSADVVPTAVTNLTLPATVGKITLADTSPNMKLHIPAAVTSTLKFRKLRAALLVVDPSGVKMRWLELDVTLNRSTRYD